MSKQSEVAGRPYHDYRLARKQDSAWADSVALCLSLLALYWCGPILSQSSGAYAGAGLALIPGLLLIIGTFAGRLAVRIRLPRLTGYIVLGAIMGPDFWHILHTWFPGTIPDTTVFIDKQQVKDIKIVNDLAIGLIALMAGAEIRLSWLRARLRSVLTIVAAKSLIIPLAIALVVGFGHTVFPFMEAAAAEGVSHWLVAGLVGCVALASSPMVVVSVIKETESDGPLSETAMGVAVLKDIVVIMAFTMIIALLSAKGGADMGSLLVEEGGQTLFYLLFSCVIGVPLGILLAVITEREAQRVSWLVVGIALVVAVLEPLAHVKPLFCLLTAGFVCENLYPKRSHRGSHRLERSLGQVAAPVFVIFFVAAGLGLHLHDLLSGWLAVVLLAGSRAVALLLSMQLGARLGGSEPVVQRYSWLTMVPQAGVTLGLAIIIGQQFPGWGAKLEGILVACVALHELIGPILLTLALKWSGEARRDAAGAH